MEKAAHNNYSFADFELDVARRRLEQNGKSVLLNAKAFDLLVFLVENRDRLLSKDEILEKVWAGQFVEENNLTVQISALRKALGESKNESRFLATVVGKGYKFVAVVHTFDEQEIVQEIIIERSKIERFVIEESDSEINYNGSLASPNDETVPMQNLLTSGTSLQNVSVNQTSDGQNLILSKLKKHYLLAIAVVLLIAFPFYFFYFSKVHKPIESIAVLPLINVGADPKTEYLSDGITDNLINDLSQSPNLKVISRSSTFRYKSVDAPSTQLNLPKIANELGVQAILTGRVEQRGDDLLISVELVDVQDNTQIWGEHYNRKFADVFKLQEEIAKDISGKLRLRLTGEEHTKLAKRYTDNIKAFEYYTKGNAYIHRRTREDILTAADYYEQAIKEDQNYALAYAGLAEVYGNLGGRSYISPSEGCRKLKESAEKAVQSDNNLADGHVMIGYNYICSAPYNFIDANREFKQAIKLSPSLAIGHLFFSLSLFRERRLDEGLVEMLKAHELDPLSTIITRQVALYYILKRDFARALEFLKQADETGPSFITTTEIDVYIQSHLYEDALAKLEKQKQQRKDDTILIFSLGMVYAAQGKRVEAMNSINELVRLSETDANYSQWIAKIYATLDDKENALKYFTKGVETGNLGIFYPDEPVWDSIRGDSRFTDLLRQMGIPQ